MGRGRGDLLHVQIVRREVFHDPLVRHKGPLATRDNGDAVACRGRISLPLAIVDRDAVLGGVVHEHLAVLIAGIEDRVQDHIGLWGSREIRDEGLEVGRGVDRGSPGVALNGLSEA